MLSTAHSEIQAEYEEYMTHQQDEEETAMLENFLKDKPEVSTKANLIENIVLKFGRVSVARIARFLNLKKDVVTFYLDTLEENGLVERKTTIVDDYIVATPKLIATRRWDLISYIQKHLGQFPARKIKNHLHRAGWERPLLDIIISNNADYIPFSVTKLAFEDNSSSLGRI